MVILYYQYPQINFTVTKSMHPNMMHSSIAGNFLLIDP